MRAMSPGSGIDIGVLFQIQKIDFWNSKIILIHVKWKFCQPQQVKKKQEIKTKVRTPFQEQKALYQGFSKTAE